jgi:hypothetical protein
LLCEVFGRNGQQARDSGFNAGGVVAQQRTEILSRRLSAANPR